MGTITLSYLCITASRKEISECEIADLMRILSSRIRRQFDNPKLLLLAELGIDLPFIGATIDVMQRNTYLENVPPTAE